MLTFQELLRDFLIECLDKWNEKIDNIPKDIEHKEWLINMINRAYRLLHYLNNKEEFFII